jgi:excisionase family DNA binding protein
MSKNYYEDLSREKLPEGLEVILKVFSRLLVAEYLREVASSTNTPAKQGVPMVPPAPSDQRYLDVTGLARYLSMPKTTIYTYVCTGKIPAKAVVRLGRSLRFEIKEIDTWVEQQRTQPRR